MLTFYFSQILFFSPWHIIVQLILSVLFSHYLMLVYTMFLLAPSLFSFTYHFRAKSYLPLHLDPTLLTCPDRLQFSSLPFLSTFYCYSWCLYILVCMDQSYLACFVLLQLLIASCLLSVVYQYEE